MITATPCCNPSAPTLMTVDFFAERCNDDALSHLSTLSDLISNNKKEHNKIAAGWRMIFCEHSWVAHKAWHTMMIKCWEWGWWVRGMLFFALILTLAAADHHHPGWSSSWMLFCVLWQGLLLVLHTSKPRRTWSSSFLRVAHAYYDCKHNKHTQTHTAHRSGLCTRKLNCTKYKFKLPNFFFLFSRPLTTLRTHEHERKGFIFSTPLQQQQHTQKETTHECPVPFTHTHLNSVRETERANVGWHGLLCWLLAGRY